jgi:hypothetical protein
MAMTDPKDLQHYLDEKIGEKSKEAQQARQRAEQEDAQIRQTQDRRHAAMALLTQEIIPFLEESKKTLTGVHLVVEPKIAADHQVDGVTFQIRDQNDKTVRSSIFEIDIGTEIPLIRRHNAADARPSGVDLAGELGVRKFEDLNKSVAARLVKLAIDEFASNK